MQPERIRILEAPTFIRWFEGLKDSQATARIRVRLRRMLEGHFGDVRSVGGGVHELRISYGPGYRIYYVRRGGQVVILLAGGDKDSQQGDIRRARSLALDPGVLEDRLW